MVRDDDDDGDEVHRSFVGATRRRFFFVCFHAEHVVVVEFTSTDDAR